ncbi:C2 family cysteine protease [Cellulomonas sp. NPDC055163]
MVIAALLVTAAVAAVLGSGYGQALACELRSLGTQAGTCGGTDVPTRYGDDGVSALRPDGSGGGAAPVSGDDGRFANATGGPEAVDDGKVSDARDSIRDALDGGFLGVRGGDLDQARDAVAGLNGAELDSLVAGMSDEELEQWVDELDDGWFQGGWDREQRRELWELLATRGSRATLDRLAGFTDELQPRFDEVGGDGARDKPESVANSGRYGEIDGQLVVGGVDPEDIAQGQIGDCWYMASLMAVAQADPGMIERAITQNPNGTFTVRLYDDGRPVDVTVTPEMVLSAAGDPAFTFAPKQTLADGRTKGYELWPLVMEKALALHWGDYATIEGDSPGLGLEVVTGRESSASSLEDDDRSLGDLASVLGDGGAITLASFPEDRDENPPIYDRSAAEGGVPSNHAYYVRSVDPEAGTVTIVNPWGSSYPPITLSYSDFRTTFSHIYVNEVS